MTRAAPRTALVTGASAGIGAAFAADLAARGFGLVLTARRTDRLEDLAERLEREHGVPVLAIPGDLAQTETPERIMAAVADAGLTVDVLINNAGYGLPPHFADLSWQEHRDFLQVMVTAVAHLTHLVLPGMVARDYGRIVQVASIAGLLPGSMGHTLYGASKAFLIRFSEALSLEMEGRNIRVQALCPGFTYSEFHDVTGGREEVSTYPGYMWMQAEDVVRRSLDGVMGTGPTVLVTGRFNTAVATAAKLLPQWALMALSRRRARASLARMADRQG